jgi:hypothetical protein
MISFILNNLLPMTINIFNNKETSTIFNRILFSVVIPILVAVITYGLVNEWGEWRKRRAYSKLGIAIIESFQEEISSGILIMKNALTTAKDNNLKSLSKALLPNKCWSGMSTIPDYVLLRIIELSEKKIYQGFHPRDCRIHCKNYFENICDNYNNLIKEYYALHLGNWRTVMINLLDDAVPGHYIEATNGVNQMLEHAKKLLYENTKKWWRPK